MTTVAGHPESTHGGQGTCKHCPDGHVAPSRCAWAVWVGSDVDGDGQPTRLYVQPTNGAHVAEADAEWLRELIRQWHQRGEPARPASTRRKSGQCPHPYPVGGPRNRCPRCGGELELPEVVS